MLCNFFLASMQHEEHKCQAKVSRLKPVLKEKNHLNKVDNFRDYVTGPTKKMMLLYTCHQFYSKDKSGARHAQRAQTLQQLSKKRGHSDSEFRIAETLKFAL